MIKIIAILLLLPLVLFSSEIDSLEKELKIADNQSQFDIYLKLSTLCRYKAPKKSEEYAGKAISVAQKLNNDSLGNAAKINLAFALHQSNKLDTAAYILSRVIENVDSIKQADLYFSANNQMAVVFGKLSKFDIALDYIHAAMLVREFVTDSSLVISLDNNYGNILLRSDETDLAIKTFTSVVQRAKKINDPVLIRNGTTNLAQALSLKGELDEAAKMMAENIYNYKDNPDFDLTVDYLNYGFLFNTMRNLDSAEFYFNKTIEHSYLHNQIQNRLIARINLISLRDFEKAPFDKLETDILAIADSAEKNNFLELKQFSLYQLINLYDLKDKPRKFADALIKYYEVKDSIGYLNTKKEIATVQADLEHKNYQSQLAIKDLELRKQKIKENYFLIGLIAFIVFSIVITIFFLSNKKMIKKLEKQNKEIDDKNNLLEENNRQMNIQKYQIESMIEDLKESKDRLETLNNQKDTFVSIFTHQLTNQVQAILMSAEAMYLGKQKTPEMVDKFSEILYHASNHLRNMLANLMEWSRTQTEYVQTNPVHFELQEIIDRNISSNKQIINKKKIDIIKVCKEQIVYADKAMIDTVFKNVISNAVKYSYEGGRIEFSCHIENNFIVSYIKDYGTGIKHDLLEKLFNIETRVATKGTLGEQGSGLGLSICKELLTLNSGKIEIETEEDKGTLVKIYLPTIN